MDAYKTFRPNLNIRPNSKSARRPNSSFLINRNKSATVNITVKSTEGRVNQVYGSLLNDKQTAFTRQKTITDQYNSRVNSLNNQAIYNNLRKIMGRENQYNAIVSQGNQSERNEHHSLRPQDSFKVRHIQLNKSRKTYLERKEKEKLDRENTRILNRLVKISSRLT